MWKKLFGAEAAVRAVFLVGRIELENAKPGLKWWERIGRAIASGPRIFHIYKQLAKKSEKNNIIHLIVNYSYLLLYIFICFFSFIVFSSGLATRPAVFTRFRHDVENATILPPSLAQPLAS